MDTDKDNDKFKYIMILLIIETFDLNDEEIIETFQTLPTATTYT